MGSPRDHWPLHAIQWSRIGPPLRPAPEDIAICEQRVAGRAAPRALLLGVTPELASMAWPAGTHLVAADRSQAMISAVFPHTAPAVVADWRALPFAAGTFDVVIGDGCATIIEFPADYARLSAELHRVLAPGGELILRLFALPATPESLADIAALPGNFHILKWRIAMALQPPNRNVRVADILRAFETLFPDRAALAATTGWSLDTISTIDVYRDSDLSYSFPTLDEARGAFADFDLVARITPTYELGDRCPTLVLQSRTGTRTM